MWQCDNVTMWQCGNVAMWQCGNVARAPSSEPPWCGTHPGAPHPLPRPSPISGTFRTCCTWQILIFLSFQNIPNELSYLLWINPIWLTRSLGARLLGCGPSGCLRTSFKPFRRSGRVTHASIGFHHHTSWKSGIPCSTDSADYLNFPQKSWNKSAETNTFQCTMALKGR